MTSREEISSSVMSLKSQYEAFLTAPTISSLAEGASLHYVPTLTTIHEPTKIIRQLTSSHLKKRDEKILGVIEGHGALVVEVETTLELVSDGGAFLPGLDDNFLADRVVTLLIVRDGL